MDVTTDNTVALPPERELIEQSILKEDSKECVTNNISTDISQMNCIVTENSTTMANGTDACKMENDENIDTKSEEPHSPMEIEHMTVVDEENSSDESSFKGKSRDHSKSKRKSSQDEGSHKKKRSSREEKGKSEENDSKRDKAGEKKVLPLLEKYWKTVKNDPNDFTGWTYLLQYVDQEGDVQEASEVYDDFLSRYPYCYGYWRKYSDFLKRKDCKEKCEQVFQRGAKAIPLSVDLWLHYLNYTRVAYINDESKVRDLFDQAILVCGMEFRSDRLWELYVRWEMEGNHLQNVTKIYDKWIKVPTQGHHNVLEKFKEHVLKNAPNKILDPEEFFTLRKEVVDDAKLENGEKDAALSDEAPPGEEAPDKLDKMNEEETNALKQKIISVRTGWHKECARKVQERWNFEENIKRPYFHVKPLESSQIENWKNYLIFEKKKEEKERVTLLYERCLIACAQYEEFWIQYIDYLRSQPTPTEKIRDVFQRAAVYHGKKVNLHLDWAFFEEFQGNLDGAAEIIEKLENESGAVFLDMILRKINLERRRGNFEKACALYEEYIGKAEDKKIVSCLIVKYARFCDKVMNDKKRAEEILTKAVEMNADDIRLHLQLIDLKMGEFPLNVEEIKGIFDKLLDACGEDNLERKTLFSQRKYEFLEDFSSDGASIQRAYKVYAEMAKTADKKRKREPSHSDHRREESHGPSNYNVSTQPSTWVPPMGPQPPPTMYQAAAYNPASYGQTGYPAQPAMYGQNDPNYTYPNWSNYGQTTGATPTAYGQQGQWTGTPSAPTGPVGYNYMY